MQGMPSQQNCAMAHHTVANVFRCLSSGAFHDLR